MIWENSLSFAVKRFLLVANKLTFHLILHCGKLIGSPDDSSLGFLRSDNARRYMRQLPQYPKQQFHARFHTMSNEATDLLEKMLVFDPNKRITGISSLLMFLDTALGSCCHLIFSRKQSCLFFCGSWSSSAPPILGFSSWN